VRVIFSISLTATETPYSLSRALSTLSKPLSLSVYTLPVYHYHVTSQSPSHHHQTVISSATLDSRSRHLPVSVPHLVLSRPQSSWCISLTSSVPTSNHNANTINSRCVSVLASTSLGPSVTTRTVGLYTGNIPQPRRRCLLFRQSSQQSTQLHSSRLPAIVHTKFTLSDPVYSAALQCRCQNVMQD